MHRMQAAQAAHDARCRAGEVSEPQVMRDKQAAIASSGGSHGAPQPCVYRYLLEEV